MFFKPHQDRLLHFAPFTAPVARPYPAWFLFVPFYSV